MPYVALMLDDAPILLVRVTGRLDPTTHFKMSQEVCDLIKGLPGKIYRINDLTGVRVHLMDMVDILGQVAKGWAGTASDPRVVTYLVLDHPNFFLGLASSIRCWQWARDTRICANMQEALQLARTECGACQAVMPGGTDV